MEEMNQKMLLKERKRNYTNRFSSYHSCFANFSRGEYKISAK